MTSKDDTKWQSLLALSAPTFATEEIPPYGFVTSTLARLQAEKRQQEIVERIGLRALLASFAALVVAVTITVGLNLTERSDLEPGVRSFVQEASVSLS